MFPKAAVRTSQEIIPEHLWEKDLIYHNLETGRGEKYKLKVVKNILFYFVTIVKGHRLFLMSNCFHFMIHGFAKCDDNEAEKVLQQRWKVVWQV